MKSSRIHACPMCGSSSTSVFITDFTNNGSRRCEECGYMGTFPTIPLSKVKGFKKKVQGKGS